MCVYATAADEDQVVLTLERRKRERERGGERNYRVPSEFHYRGHGDVIIPFSRRVRAGLLFCSLGKFFLVVSNEVSVVDRVSCRCG